MPRSSSNPFAGSVNPFENDAPETNDSNTNTRSSNSNPSTPASAAGPTNPFAAPPSAMDGDGSNPFAGGMGDDDDANNNNPAAAPPPGHNPFASAANPFDHPPQSSDYDDPDHRGSNKIGSFLKGKINQNKKGSGLIAGMDADDDDDDNNNNTGEGEIIIIKARKGSVPDDDNKGNVEKLTKWLRGTKKDDESSEEEIMILPDGRRKRRKRKKKEKKQMQQWPYDDFHIQQQKYYDEMMSREEQQLRGGGGGGGGDDYNLVGGGDGDPIVMGEFQRPEELMEVGEAVRGLNLVDFEKKAEERAIVIVSTWLFDNGLIDELLVASRGGYNGNGNGKGGDGKGGKEEGVEVGASGFPLGGGMDGMLKVDKEIEKLRNTTLKELSVINTRLNEGVAASGAEVQELVNAVEETKGDLSRLRQLSTYIMENAQKSDEDVIFLAKFPKLRLAVNARRNIFRCFRELEFFSQIPATCHRLKEELHSGEWSGNEWRYIRKVCMEHVELEILLVEAEAGIKARIAEEEEEESQAENEGQTRKSAGMLQRGLSSSMFGARSSIGSNSNDRDVVDKFLGQHIRKVWELGDEIQGRILAELEGAFNLAINDPSGLVALIEAVEVYERAAEQYKDLYGERSTLNFTDVKGKALSKIYTDFELRGLEVFRTIHQNAADDADEEDARNSQFSAVLNGSSDLVAQIEIVKTNMAPCFPPNWAIETLWSSCVAHVCSNQILQQIGGPEGNSLPELQASQLLDLVAWVEFFRDQIEESFPHVAQLKTSNKTYYDQLPELFKSDNKKEVDMDTATDSLAWVNNMLWEVHRMAQDEILNRTREQSDEWLSNVFDAEVTRIEKSDGHVTSNLCEDVFSIVGAQLRTLRDHLSKKSDALVMAVCLVFSQLREKQIETRERFVVDFRCCCCAANDFNRMSEKCEDQMEELIRQCEFTSKSEATLQASSDELLAIYSADAVYAAKSTFREIFENIEEAGVHEEFFTAKWEEEPNACAYIVVNTLEDYKEDLFNSIDPIVVNKAIEGWISGTAIFYIRCLLIKAEAHTGNKPFFKDPAHALDLMAGDIQIFRDFFEHLAETQPVIQRKINEEFETLNNMHEIMQCAAQGQPDDALDFIIVMHKKIMDVNLTKRLFADLWHLIKPPDERAIWDLFENMDDELRAFDNMPNQLPKVDRVHVPGLRYSEMIAQQAVKSKRKVPIKRAVLDAMTEKIKEDWRLGDDDEE